jgi:uncharacterized membrane protein YqiK
MPVRTVMMLCLAAMAVVGCGPQSQQEQAADRIRDQADAQADAIESDARNEAGRMEMQAEQLLNQSGDPQSYKARRLDVQAKALRDEAKLVEEQAEAQAKAVRDQGRAQASALVAK